MKIYKNGELIHSGNSTPVETITAAQTSGIHTIDDLHIFAEQNMSLAFADEDEMVNFYLNIIDSDDEVNYADSV